MHGRVQNLLSWVNSNGNGAELQVAAQKRPPVRANELLVQKESSDHAWVYDLSQREYLTASERLLQLGLEEKVVGRSKTLLSLAKLARVNELVQSKSQDLVGDLLYPISDLDLIELQEHCSKVPRLQTDNSSAKETCNWIETVDDNLAVRSTQLSLPVELVRDIGAARDIASTDPAEQPILKLHFLVDLCVSQAQQLLQADRKSQWLSYMLQAIATWLRMKTGHYSAQAVQNAQLTLWAKLILMNNWLRSKANLRESAFYCVCQAISMDRHTKLNEVLPPLAQLLSCNELSPHNQSSQFKHNIQSAYELVMLMDPERNTALDQSMSRMSVVTPRRATPCKS
ncbi:hypothetical protein Ciccas_003547 [Cichlidogyrus casuarinus]|uniref:Uncharacterized protein n=1 Tax=Cichlidogyrus casuarinus TaxID=1844966 RepID=A0ABD2QE44_9PLAT